MLFLFILHASKQFARGNAECFAHAHARSCLRASICARSLDVYVESVPVQLAAV